MDKMSDCELSNHEQRRLREEQRTMGRGMASRGVSRGAVRVNGGDDLPPTPPATCDGPAGHYSESENEETGVEHMTEAEFDHYLESQLSAAEASLNDAIAAAKGSAPDEEGMNRISDVIQALGFSILSSRQALMSVIKLRAATANLIEHTTARATGACEAIVEATRDFGA